MSYEQQLAHRKSRYKIMMGMRIPLMIAAAAFYQYPWIAVGLLVLSIPLPWMAVLIANDRLPMKVVDPQRYRGDSRSGRARCRAAGLGANAPSQFLATRPAMMALERHDVIPASESSTRSATAPITRRSRRNRTRSSTKSAIPTARP